MDKLFLNTFSSYDKYINKDEIALLNNQNIKISEIIKSLSSLQLNIKYISISLVITNTILVTYLFYFNYYLQKNQMTYNINI